MLVWQSDQASNIQHPSTAAGLFLYQLNEVSDLVYLKFESKTMSLGNSYKNFQLGVKIPNLKMWKK